MTVKNNVHPAVMHRNIELVDEYIHGHEADYILDQGKEDDHEYRCDEELGAQKAFFMKAWSASQRAEELIGRQALRELARKGVLQPTPKDFKMADRQRCNIENCGAAKDELFGMLKYLQASEDLVLMGAKDRSFHINELSSVYRQCRVLLTYVGLRERFGFSWKSLAALHNNVLSLMENMKLPVKDRYYKRNQFAEGKPIVDFEFNDDAEQTKDGLQWNEQMRWLYYELG